MSADEAAIRALIERYADAVFRRDAADWGVCWAENSRWVLAGTEVHGRDAIVAMWQQAMAGFSFVAFFSQIGRLEIDADQGRGHVWTNELLETVDGGISRPVGRYDDRYVRTADGWRFAERVYTMLKG